MNDPKSFASGQTQTIIFHLCIPSLCCSSHEPQVFVKRMSYFEIDYIRSCSICLSKFQLVIPIPGSSPVGLRMYGSWSGKVTTSISFNVSLYCHSAFHISKNRDKKTGVVSDVCLTHAARESCSSNWSQDCVPFREIVTESGGLVSWNTQLHCRTHFTKMTFRRMPILAQWFGANYLSRSFCTAVGWTSQTDSGLWSSFFSTHFFLFVLVARIWSGF